MVTMNGKTMKKRKLIIFLGALFLALILSVGTYAYTFSIAATTLNVTAAGAGITTQQPAPPGDQPEWNEVLPQSEFEQETLRPNGQGNVTGINDQYPATGEHWDKVDDIGPDEWDTYVFTDRHLAFDNDRYQIEDHSTGTGTINAVTVYFRFAADAGGTAEARALLRTNGNNYTGTTYVQTENNFITMSETWTLNPRTNEPWLWTEIDDMQAGIGIRSGGAGQNAYCTQVFVLVDYELPPIIEGEVPDGDLFIVTPHPGYTGDLLMNIYVTNTGLLRLAYQYLNLKLYVGDSLEAGETPNYQILSLENGVATFNIEGGSASSYTVSVVGGGYALISGDANEWGAGWDHIPELYCEVVQR